MSKSPLVSVITIFYNSETFISEAIESVIQQSYDNCELLLVDDGSTDGSTEIAKSYTKKLPEKIKYFDHEDHKNLGLSASRNLGLKMSKGELIAFLDSDDVWLSEKLAEQVSIFNKYPDVDMTYCNALDWFGWSGKDDDKLRDNFRNFSLQLMSPNTIFDPPELLKLLINNRRASPYPSTIMIKKHIAESVGGFNDDFTVTYDDQVFYAKVLLISKAYVSNNCWLRYRKHGSSITSETVATGKFLVYRLSYLLWLKDYLVDKKFHDDDVRRMLNERIEDTKNAILKKLNKTHNKIKRLEHSQSQKQKTIERLKKTKTPTKQSLEGKVVKLNNKRSLRAMLEAFFYFIITGCLSWWPLELSFFKKAYKDKNKKIAYYLLRFPEFSQTFIQREVIALKRSGLTVKTFANKIDNEDKLDSVGKALMRGTIYLNPPQKRRLHKYKEYFYSKNKLRYINLFIYILCHRYERKKTLRGDIKTFEQSIYLAGRLMDREFKHVHCPWANKSAFVALIASRLLGIKYSVQARAYDLTRSDKAFGLKEKFENADFIVVNSLYNKNIAENYISKNTRNKIKLVYNEAVSLEKFNPVVKASQKTKVIKLLCVGRYVEQKGLVYLLKACNILKNKAYSFLCELIGGPVIPTYQGYFIQLKEHHKKLGLEDSVIFSGALPFNKVLECYSSTDIFVLPCVIASKYGARDNIPNAIIEAMAMKLPVVSTTVTGIPEIIDNEIDGLLVPPNNEDKLAEAICRLIEDEELRRTLGENARKKIEQKFDINKNIKEFSELFKQ